jgi:TolB-like protein
MRRIAVLSAALTVHTTISLSAQCPNGSAPPCQETNTTQVQVDSNALAILPFRTSGPVAEIEWLREGMVDLLSVSLDGFAGWRTVQPRTILARVTMRVQSGDAATAARSARSSGAASMVLGSAVAVGPQLRLHAELYDAVRVTRLAVVDARGPLDRPGPVVDSIAVGLARERLRLHPALGGHSPHEYATASPLALRIYVVAERAARQGDFRSAAESLERVVTLDSSFGEAYSRLAVLLTFLGSPGGRFNTVRMIRTSLLHANGLPQRQRDLLEALDLQQRGLLTEALRRGDDLGRRYPDDAEAAYVEGESYYHFGIFLGESRARGLAAFARGVQLDPGLLDNYNHAIELRCVLGDSVGAWALLHRALAGAPSYLVARALKLALLVGLQHVDPVQAMGDLGTIDTGAVAARAMLEAVRAFDPNPALAVATADTIAALFSTADQPRATRTRFLLGRSMLRLAQGRLAASDSLILEARVLDPIGTATTEASALRALMVGDGATARAQARRLAEASDDASKFNSAMIAVWAAALDGDTGEAAALVRSEVPADLFPEYRTVLLAGLGGYAALAHGDSATARSTLARLMDVVPYTSLLTNATGTRHDVAPTIALELARLERATGSLGSAREWLAFSSFASGLTLNRADAEELSGEIAEQQGDTIAAIMAYRNFVALWANADPALQPRVAAARGALARLEQRSGSGPLR